MAFVNQKKNKKKKIILTELNFAPKWWRHDWIQKFLKHPCLFPFSNTTHQVFQQFKYVRIVANSSTYKCCLCNIATTTFSMSSFCLRLCYSTALFYSKPIGSNFWVLFCSHENGIALKNDIHWVSNKEVSCRNKGLNETTT